jgi:hypothetical protein
MNELSDIWDIIDDANLSIDLQTRQRQLEIAIGQLTAMAHAGDVRAWYPLGYAYYCHPNRRDRCCLESIETVRAFDNALFHNVEESLSHLYLAYHYFDFREFESAKYHIDKVCSEKLEEIMRLRHAELAACISICRFGFESARAEILEYARLVQSLHNLGTHNFCDTQDSHGCNHAGRIVVRSRPGRIGSSLRHRCFFARRRYFRFQRS